MSKTVSETVSKYEILIGKKWFKCRKAVELDNLGEKFGWLEYEDENGDGNGLQAPGQWRKTQ